jgi:uncharacterized membrane protein
LYYNGGYTDINDPLATISGPGGPVRGTYLSGINNNGQVIGSYCTGPSTCHQRGFVYSDGIYTEIDDPLASDPLGSTTLTGINDSGAIVGTFENGVLTTIPGSEQFTYGVPQGFLYQDGIFTTISVPGEAFTALQGITNAGLIYGVYCNDVVSCNDPTEFSYRNGTYSNLSIHFPGAAYTDVQDINSSGDASGRYCTVGGSNCPRGFTYIGGVYTQLAYPSGLQIQTAFINDLGDVAGSVTTADVVLVPEPATWALVLVGCGAIGATLRRHRRERSTARPSYRPSPAQHQL